MAGRPPKTSIDYAGWDVNIFDSEPKIDKLLDAQGCVGFVIYFYLCQRAYGSHGYYYPWCYDDAATTARKIGGGAGAQSVEETVRYCLQIGLFDNGLFDRWKILTSRGIQKRYAQVALTRTKKSVISEYWLLADEECEGLYKVGHNSNLSPGNAYFAPDNGHFFDSKLKERKGKETKENQTKERLAGFAALWGVYPRKENKGDAQEAYEDLGPDEQLQAIMIEAARQWTATERWTKEGGRYVPALHNWIRKQRWADELPQDHAQPGKHTADHDYHQRQYDEAALEGLLYKFEEDEATPPQGGEEG